MKIIKGIYNEAKVFADTIDEKAVEQIRQMCSLPFLKDAKIRVMPDVHAGAGCTIGTTMTIHDAIVPNYVGVDIGCGMEVTMIIEKDVDLKKLDEVIHQRIPAGFEIHDRPVNAELIDLQELKCFRQVSLDRAYRSIGTLGGGNHFIELDVDEQGNYYLVIHSGSRHAGCEVADYYQEQAHRALKKTSEQDIRNLVAEYKAQGRQKEIQQKLQELMKEANDSPDKDHAYVTGELLEDYLHDMKIMQKYAALNRQTMRDIILEAMNWTAAETFTTIHNYIDMEQMILRKGSVSAKEGEKLIIPINMKDGSLICTGKGNPDWNFSAPHGAGRLFSRGEARRSFTIAQYAKEMEGIYTTSVSLDTIDEAPMAYKSMDEIVRNIQDTVTVDQIIRPVYNFKAG